MSDLDCYNLPKTAHQWLLDSPFEQSAVQTGNQLAALGYKNRTIVCYLACISHFAHWSETERLSVANISDKEIEKFIRFHLPTCRCAPRCQKNINSVRAAVLFWQRVARSSGLTMKDPDNLTPLVRNELEAFRHYLSEVRGLQSITCDTRVHHISDFLTSRVICQSTSVEQLTPADIVDYMARRTKDWKPASIKAACGALSSYLRFKAIDGKSTTKLIAALPKVAQWRQASLPKALSVDEINILLSAFDLNTRGGQRDYAIARCYVDLGLRTAEIVRLKLEDIDWCEGVVHIHSKGARVDVLPLPKLTGKAIARYLEHRSSEHATRSLFLRLNPPLNRAATADTIRGSIRNAARRSGLSDRLTGPHRLRHTLAIRLVNAGVSLKEISDLMRHRDLDTTTIYAKTDINALKAVASAWPEKSL